MSEILIKEALNKAFVKARPERAAIDKFKANLITLIDGIQNNPTEREEFQKNLFSDFLKNTWYAPEYFINTHKSVDLVIHNGNSASPIGVMIEAKKPGNKNEMVSRGNLNVKAMQELLLYYFRETIDENNINLKHLIITNAIEWFIFDAREFYHHFSRNKTLVDLYSDFKANFLLGKETNYFYTSIALPYIEKVKNDIEYTYFNITEYEKIIRNNDKEEDNKLINLYKILSPNHLLKKSFVNDSNTLNQNFYAELLYIIGLTEDKEEGKKIIVRNEESKRQPASLIEETIYQLSNDVTDNEMLFDISLELNITWINRIIFLKLLEAQQLQYQNKNMDYAFLNARTIKNFNELNILFFNVLAVEPKNRAEKDKNKFKNVPYLNSSLFEKTDNEQNWLIVSTLQNEEMDIFPSTVLKDEIGNRRKGKIKLLDYLFEFLNAYDFSSEGTEQIQEEKKTLINASVLGLIFEKINGYKDGSYFTPGFITSYICSETVKNVVIKKFNEAKGWNAKNLDDIYNKIDAIKIMEANEIINGIKILDPAVGSGHFLVSALNEILALKSFLGILSDKNGRKIKDYRIFVENDELIINDSDDGKPFVYKSNIAEKQRIQETIFNEKRRIIENCLFGVDLNPNSVKICRLRLWIELLKNAYYTNESDYKELETLPNLELNIKCGNSLISRYEIDIDISEAIKSLDFTIEDYKKAVNDYKNLADKQSKQHLIEKLEIIKNSFKGQIKKRWKYALQRQSINGELISLTKQDEFFDYDDGGKSAKRITYLQSELSRLEQIIDDIEQSKIFNDAFEWRFEFPELLDDNANFMGFDVVIGNPPYLREGKISKELFIKYNNSPYYQGKMDIWYLFACLGINLLNENGILCFIATNNWTTAAGASKLRNYIIQKTKILQLIDFGKFLIFENASIQTMIMLLARDEASDNYSFDYRKLQGDTILSDVLDILDKRENDKAEYLSPVISRKYLEDKFLTFSSISNDILFKKITQNAFYLEDDELANGIHPHYDFVNNKLAIKYKLKKGDGIFGLSNQEKHELNLSKKELNLVKPYYTTDQVKKYHTIQKNDLWIIYTNSSFKNSKSMDKYPNLKKHLDRYKDVITSDNKPYGLHRSREEKFFHGDKIIVQRKCADTPLFSFSDFDCYVSATFYIIKTDRINLKYLVGLLNSKLIAFWLKNKGKMQGSNYQLDKEPLLQLPLFKASAEQQKPIITLVDKILSAKKDNHEADVSNYENKINEKIYSLYQLTPEEIEIVERSR